MEQNLNKQNTPGDFNELDPGTVFEFHTSGRGFAWYVWNGQRGMLVTQSDARRLAQLPAAEALAECRSTRVYLEIQAFGSDAMDSEYEDFNRVTICTDDSAFSLNPSLLSRTTAVASEVHGLMPHDFNDMTPGTVFEFDQPGFGPAWFVWNQEVGIQVTREQAMKLAALPSAEALQQSRMHTQVVREFGPTASVPVNQDFSRVKILSGSAA
ncbi:MAG: hypothetical protein AAB544_05780 [Patescibacteria group bacterium]